MAGGATSPILNNFFSPKDSEEFDKLKHTVQAFHIEFAAIAILDGKQIKYLLVRKKILHSFTQWRIDHMFSLGDKTNKAKFIRRGPDLLKMYKLDKACKKLIH